MKNLTEFSTQFDILYNSIMSNQAPSVNEYEKSVFLTKSQDEIVKNYFNPKGNKYQEGFDDSKKRDIDFSNLVTVDRLLERESPEGEVTEEKRFDSRSKLFNFPSDAMFILNESVVSSNRMLVVVPVAYDEYLSLMSKPYKMPVKGQAWRLVLHDTIDKTRYAEIVGNFGTGAEYVIRYVRRPNPIILTDLNDSYSNLSINGKTAASMCELDENLHEEILQRAVELAKSAYIGDLNSSITMGQRSE